MDLKFGIEDLKLIIQHIQKRFPQAVFVRIEPKGKLPDTKYLVLKKSKNIQPGKTLVVDLVKPEEDLLAQMHSKTRYNIRLAEKHGVEILEEFDLTNGHGLFFAEALELIASTSLRQGFKGYPVEYYRNLVDFFAVKNPESNIKVHLYKAVWQGKLLASAIFLDFAGTRTYLFGGSSQDFKNIMAPHLLHFTAIKDAKAAGFKSYDFWGLETSSGKLPGFVRFKQGFGGSEKQYAGAFDLMLKPWGYKAYQGLRVLKSLAQVMKR
jgi:lipid II:glycine glycyltransferase (peptidoglycan interpeptide bridge formation enzyme)